MKDEFRNALLSELRSEALNTALNQWVAEAEIVYTEAGEAWKVPEEEAADEAAEEQPAQAEEVPAE